jgi:hypothetical protein
MVMALTVRSAGAGSANHAHACWRRPDKSQRQGPRTTLAALSPEHLGALAVGELRGADVRRQDPAGSALASPASSISARACFCALLVTPRRDFSSTNTTSSRLLLDDDPIGETPL